MKNITFLFPGFCFSPVGGFKLPLEYANMLAADGCDVNVVYGDGNPPYKRMAI